MLHCYNVTCTLYNAQQGPIECYTVTYTFTLCYMYIQSVTCTLYNAQRGPIECYPLQNKEEMWSAREHLRTDAVLTQPRLHTRALKIDDPLFGHKL